MKLTIIRGASGSGKSTLARKISQGERIFETDMYFFEKENTYLMPIE